MMAMTLFSDHHMGYSATATEFLQELVSQLQEPEKLGNE